MLPNHILQEFNHKKIFVTGGTGFFGKSILSYIKRYFLDIDTSWTILSRNPKEFLLNCPEFNNLHNIHFIQGDVRNFSYKPSYYDWIIHAATPAITGLPKGEMHSIIVQGTKHILEFAKQCNANKIIMTSSGAVYGIQPPDLEYIPETFPCNPITEYGKAKLIAEQMCIDSGAIIPRCFAFVGPYLNKNIHFAIGNFMRDCLNNKDIIIQGDGTPYRSYLYADDLVEWLFTLLVLGKNGVAYNVGSQNAISIYELAQKVRTTLKVSNQIRILTPISENKKPERYVPSTAKIQKELNVKQTVNLEEAILLSCSL